MSPPSRSATAIAAAVFPTAVGPQITTSASGTITASVLLSPEEPSLKLRAGHCDQRGAAVEAGEGIFRLGKVAHQRGHLVAAERIAGFDRRLARGGDREAFQQRLRSEERRVGKEVLPCVD